MVQNKRALLSVLTIGLALLLTGGVRSAAADQRMTSHQQKPGAPTSGVPSPMRPGISEGSYCDKTTDEPNHGGSAGPTHRRVLCLERRFASANGATPNIPPDWPVQCLPDEMHVIDRLHGCQWITGILTMYEIDTGAVLGTAEVDTYQSDALNPSARQLSERLEILMTNPTGVFLVSPGSVRGTYGCSMGGCSLVSQDPPALAWATIVPNQLVTFNGVLSADSQPLQFDPEPDFFGSIQNDASPLSSAPFGTWGLQGIRCDSDPVFAHTNPSGCVYSNTVLCEEVTDDTKPQTCIWQTYIPTFAISLSGNAPETAAHIQDAENRLIRNPGLDQINGIPLTRQTDPKQTRANRRTACSGFSREFTNDSCDEYPFASTNQGAAGANGNYSTEHVPLNDNKSGGAQLGGFYRSNRILNGDPFWVKVIG